MEATIVKLENVTSNLGICFKTTAQVYFYISTYTNGIANISFSDFTTLPNALKTVVGLFHKESNLYGFKKINFVFDGVIFEVTEQTAVYEQLVMEYFKKK